VPGFAGAYPWSVSAKAPGTNVVIPNAASSNSPRVFDMTFIPLSLGFIACQNLMPLLPLTIR
jgi:hypothetical protein